MEQFFALQPVQHRLTRERITVTTLYLQGTIAENWGMDVAKAVNQMIAGDSYTDSWAEFVTVFLNNFGIPNEGNWAIHELKTLYQGNVPVNEYIGEFERLRRIANLAPEQCLYEFQVGLKPAITKELLLQRPIPATLAEWHLGAREEEQRQQQVTQFMRNQAMYRSGSHTHPAHHSSAPRQSSRPKERDPDAMDIDAIGQARLRQLEQRQKPPQRKNPPRDSRPQGPRQAPTRNN